MFVWFKRGFILERIQDIQSVTGLKRGLEIQIYKNLHQEETHDKLSGLKLVVKDD